MNRSYDQFITTVLSDASAGCPISQTMACALIQECPELSEVHAAYQLLIAFQHGSTEQRKYIKDFFSDYSLKGNTLPTGFSEIANLVGFFGDPKKSQGRNKSDQLGRGLYFALEIYNRRKNSNYFELPKIEYILSNGVRKSVEFVISQNSGLENWLEDRTGTYSSFSPDDPESLHFLGLSSGRLLRLYNQNRNIIIVTDLVNILFEGIE